MAEVHQLALLVGVVVLVGVRGHATGPQVRLDQDGLRTDADLVDHQQTQAPDERHREFGVGDVGIEDVEAKTPGPQVAAVAEGHQGVELYAVAHGNRLPRRVPAPRLAGRDGVPGIGRPALYGRRNPVRGGGSGNADHGRNKGSV